MQLSILAALRRIDEGLVAPNAEAYATLLRKCRSLSEGKELHAHVVQSGWIRITFVGNMVMQMYSNCGSLADAWQVFCTIRRNLFSWNIILTAHTQNGAFDGAEKLFEKMPEQDVVSWNVMFTAFADCGHMQMAKLLFDQMPHKDEVSWNSMMQAYVENKQLEDARDLFNVTPKRNVVSWNTMVQAYGQAGHLPEAQEVLDRMPHCDLISWTSLVTAYIIHRNPKEAKVVFDTMPERNVVSWNAMMQAHAQCGELGLAAEIFREMPERDVITWSTLVSAYAHSNRLESARIVFERMPRWSIFAWNAMNLAFAERGDLRNSKMLFDEVPEKNNVSWNTMIQAYTESGCLEDAARVFERMPEHDVISYTTMVAANSQGGRLDIARSIFEQMPQRNLVSWNAMMAGYVQNGHSKRALKLLKLMDLDGMKLNEISFVVALDACANLSALAEGKLLISGIGRQELDSTPELGNAVINLFGKCGRLEQARYFFDEMVRRDVIAWNTLIAAYAQAGHSYEAIELFQLMNLDGAKQDSVTFLSVISACSHSGLTKKAREYFHSITRDYGVFLTMEQYMCMADVLGRSGKLADSRDLINSMPFKANLIAWTTLLSACKSHGNVEIGEYAASRVIEFNPGSPTPYIVLSTIYAAVGDWKGVARLKKVIDELNSAPESLLMS